MNPAGLLLAAGGGSRMGTPKALVADPSVGRSSSAGCASCVRAGARPSSWSSVPRRSGPASSAVGGRCRPRRGGVRLGAGPERLAARRASSPCSPRRPTWRCVLLVDLPDVGAERGREGHGRDARRRARAALARAAYQGVPGHPVVLGRDHWSASPRPRHRRPGRPRLPRRPRRTWSSSAATSPRVATSTPPPTSDALTTVRHPSIAPSISWLDE